MSIFDKVRPWLPTPAKHYQQRALKALEVGEASGAQQRAALKFIVDELSNRYEAVAPHHFPDSVRDTDFAAGRAYVGKQIVALLNSPLIPEDDKEPYDDR